MNLFAQAALTFGVGLIGAMGAGKIRLPAITGSMLAVLIFGLLTPYAYFPIQARPAVQAVAGAIIGLGIDREAVLGLKKVGKPLLVFLVGLFGITIVAAMLMMRITPLSSATALLACAPGGVTDMALIAGDLEADAMTVALLQMIRMLVGVGVFPLLTQAYLKRHDHNRIAVKHRSGEEEGKRHEQKKISFFGNVLPTLIITAIGGFIGSLTGFPAAPLSCTLILVAVFQLGTGRACVPPPLRLTARVVAGAVVVSGAPPDFVQRLHLLIIPLLIMLASLFVINFLLGPFLAKRYKLDLFTMLLACTPAGVSDMALMADEMGGDQPKVLAFQIVRLVAVVLFIPLLAKLFLMIL